VPSPSLYAGNDIKSGLPDGGPATEPPGHGASHRGMGRVSANIRAPVVGKTKWRNYETDRMGTQDPSSNMAMHGMWFGC